GFAEEAKPAPPASERPAPSAAPESAEKVEETPEKKSGETPEKPPAAPPEAKKALTPEEEKTAAIRVRELKPGEKPTPPPPAKPARPAVKPTPAAARRPAPPKKKDFAKILGPLPRKQVSMDFRGMDVDNVLLMFSTWAGVTILKDPGLSGPVNLIQGREVPLLDAFKILEAVLNQKGYTLEREGPVLKVVPKPKDGPPPSATPPRPAEPPKEEKKPDDDKTTRIFPLQYASSTTVARIINDLFGGAAQPGQPQPGQPGGPPPNQGGPTPPPGARPAGAPGQPAGRKAAAQVKATADFDTNKVLVTGDPAIMEDVEKVILELDKKPDTPLQTRSWVLDFAEVNDVATQVAALLGSISGTGRAGFSREPSYEQRVFGGFNPFRSNTGPTTAAGGRVISDPRTNTLTVIATEEQLDQVDEVVKALDKKVEYASTTFIIPLKHVEATEAAFMLGQLFQQQRNNNDFFPFFFGGGGNRNQNQVRQRRRIGDPQSTRPSLNNRQNNNNPFGISSDESASVGTAEGSDSSAQSDPIRRERRGNPQFDVQAVTTGEDPQGDLLPLPSTITIDGAQLAQWWGDFNRNNAPTTGRDESGRVRPLVDLQGKITIVPNLNSNALLVNTNPSNLPALKDVIALIDRPTAQVLIEAIIVEASLDESTKLGFTLNWTESPAFGNANTTQRTTVNLPVADAIGGIKTTILGQSFDAVVQAVKSDRRFRVLSTPRIFTQNNRQAAIAIGQEVPIPNARVSFGSTSQEVDYRTVGVVLDVTPHVTADGFVNIEVGQDANDIAGFATLFGSQVPIINRRTTETTVSLKDGQTAVLGGLIRNSTQNINTKIPILGDLPIIGSLFRSKDKANSNTELMVFLRAQIVNYADELEDLKDRQGKEAGIHPDSPAGKILNLKEPDSRAPQELPKNTPPGALPATTNGPL
ncbi:MAG: hypothetical protein KY468_07620, partial [Armatimonadetes bacterium]|nr:hypothetical protein [Armatimonadota bacterium]